MGSGGKSGGGGQGSAPAPLPPPPAPPPEEPERREPGAVDAHRRAPPVKKEEDELTGLKSNIKDKSKGKTLLGN